MDLDQHTAELPDALESDELDDRVTAIQVLGGNRDSETLHRPREHMKLISREHHALYIAMGNQNGGTHAL